MKKIFALIAGYVECALACRTTPIELLFRPNFRGPPQVSIALGPRQFAGLTALGSGAAFATMSTTVIASGALVFHSLILNSASAVSSGTPFPALVVSSIVDNVSFAIGFADQAARAPGGTIMWELRRTR